MMSWAAKYIGILFVEHGRTREGCDCWGLLRLVYREEFGIELPGYDERNESIQEMAEIQGLINRL